MNSARLITTGKTMDNNKIKNNKLNYCQQTILHHNPVTLKHQSVTITKYKDKTSSLLNYTSQPSCSNAKIYGMRSKEELHVPSDVLSSNKKSLGVEVCVTMACNDNKRIGSAESAGSHDSINQEIHHFKPIKPALRTLVTMTSDGKLIEPKLVKVIPVIKKVTNIIPKPPSPSNIKQIFGCSWSAFRGKTRHNLRYTEKELDKNNQLKSRQLTKLTKTFDTARKIDLAQDTTFENNKNYTKNINPIINGTKVIKKLNINDNNDIINLKTSKNNKIKNGLTGKNKKLKNTITENKHLCNNEISQTSSKINSVSSSLINENNNDDKIEDDDSAIINIAERIKQRTKNTEQNKKLNSPRKTRSKTLNNKNINIEHIEIPIKSKKTKLKLNNTPIKMTKLITNNNNDKIITRKTRNSTRKKNNYQANNDDNNNDNEDDKNHDKIDNNIDDFIVCNKEKSKNEKLLLQEQEDFELARKLQEKLNWGGVRTRGSKRALESNNIELDLKKIKINGQSLSTDNGGNIKYRRKQKQTTK